MNAELSIPEKLRINADLVVRTMRDGFDIELTFDRAGVEWIEGYINDMRGILEADRRQGVVDRLASFVGECIIKSYGGMWVEKDGWWGVRVSYRIWACPFSKIEKHFENGSEDSVASFFNCIPILDSHFSDDNR
jgi:hypothetical protein